MVARKAAYIESAAEFAMRSNEVFAMESYGSSLKAFSQILGWSTWESRKAEIRADSERKTAESLALYQERALERERRKRDFLPASFPGLVVDRESGASDGTIQLPNLLSLITRTSTNTPPTTTGPANGPQIDPDDMAFFKSKAKLNK